jgi:hypothetical protein
MAAGCATGCAEQGCGTPAQTTAQLASAMRAGDEALREVRFREDVRIESSWGALGSLAV